MAQGLGESVVIDMCRHEVGTLFSRFVGISHSYASACGSQQWDVISPVADGKGAGWIYSQSAGHGLESY